MAKDYRASVITEDGNLKIMNLAADEYGFTSKAEVTRELRQNGYKVRFVCKPEDFDEACEKYGDKLEKAAAYSQIRRRVKKEMKKYEF